MSVILFVRISTDLDQAELERRVKERKPQFEEVPGLVQKIYGRDPATGDGCGIYFFQDQASLEAFKESELARTIPSAYESTNVRREVFQTMFPLRPGVGPVED